MKAGKRSAEGTPVSADGWLRTSTFAHGTMMATVLLAARMGCQAAVLIGIARIMEAEGYGVFAAVVSLASLVAPMSGLGADFLAMRAVAQRPELMQAAFRRAVRLTFASALPLMLLAGGIASFIFGEHVSSLLIVAVLLADVLMLRLCELVAKLYQGRNLILQMGLVRLFPALFRLIAVGFFLLAPIPPTPAHWAVLYFAGSIGAAALAVGWLMRERVVVAKQSEGEQFRWQDGMHFAGGVMSVRLHTEADKSLVLALSGAAGAGIYAAAYRIVEFLLIPIGAVVSVAYGRLFGEAHRSGLRSVSAMGLRFTLLGLTLGSVLAVGIWQWLVPVMVWTVGPSFAAVAQGLPALAMLPMAMSLRMTGEQNTAAIARLRSRSLVQWCAAACALCANLLLIPRFGWVAAVWVCVAVEFILGVIYLALVLSVYRHARSLPEAPQ